MPGKLSHITGFVAVFQLAILLIGCGQEPSAKPAKQKQSILKQKTQKIGKYDPAAGRKVSDSKVRASNPITGPLEAYGPMIEQISKTHIDHGIALYHAEHGRYPTYDEFMTQVIQVGKPGGIQLPMLPGKMEYQFDEENHKLVVVHPKGEGDGADKPAE